MTYGTGGYIQNVFMYPVNKAVTMFRSGAMTLPWVRDLLGSSSVQVWQALPAPHAFATTLTVRCFAAGGRLCMAVAAWESANDDNFARPLSSRHQRPDKQAAEPDDDLCPGARTGEHGNLVATQFLQLLGPWYDDRQPL